MGGWGVCPLRSSLNNATLNSLENKQYVKEISKQYIATMNNANSVTTSQDKLWLLSCSEIWNSGYNGGNTRGYAITKEGEQYKYYKNINANYNNNNSKLIKKATGIDAWWIRSPFYNNSNTVCYVNNTGRSAYGLGDVTYGITPGFAI